MVSILLIMLGFYHISVQRNYIEKGYKTVAIVENILKYPDRNSETFEEEYVTLLVTLKLNDAQLAKYFDMTVLPLDKESSANEILDLLEIPSEISDSITLNNLIKII